MKFRNLVIAATGALVAGGIYSSVAQGQAAFGTDDDLAYAAQLWAALEEAHFVGQDVVHGTLFMAPSTKAPNPMVLSLRTLFADITIDGVTAPAVIKRNYGPEGVTVAEVDVAPNDHLAAITVMYQRPGFNADTNDWFWVKWLPDGTLDLAGETQMAGNVGGCIGCHGDAPGNDWIFVTDRAMHPAVAADGGM